MTATSRIDAIARGLAGGSAADEPLDRIARAVATPISRRRAFRLAAAAAGTSMFVLRTETAHACASCPQPLGPQGLTQFCGYPVGVGCKFACCDPRDECCKADGGVKCCRPYEGFGCGPIVNDLPTCECKHPCGDGDCCGPDDECIVTDAEDGQAFCERKCLPGRVRCDFAGDYQCCPVANPCCGEGCCDALQTCCGEGQREQQACCGLGYGCSTNQFGFSSCSCLGRQQCGALCCPLGQVCDGDNTYPGACRGPRWEDLEDALDSLGKSLGLGGADAGGYEASSATASRRSPAEAAAAPGSADALAAIAAVKNLGALAFERLRASRPDSAFRRAVRVLRPKLAPIAPGPGLDASAAKALHRLLSAEARAWALVNAAAVAQGRSLGAVRAGELGAARSHARAYGRFAGQAAKALRRVPALRAAAVAELQAGGTPELTISPARAEAFQDAVRKRGLPADLRVRLRQLGLRRADQRSVAKIIVARRPTGGPVLIAPLKDGSRATATARLAKVLKRTAARSRKQPLVSSKGGPRTVAGVRPHASKSSGRRRT